MQFDLETQRILIFYHVRSAVIQEPAASGPRSQQLDQIFQRQTLRFCECHGFGYGLVDTGDHNLVGRLGGLAGAARAHMTDFTAHGLQHGQCPPEIGFFPTGHDCQRAFDRTLGAATDRTIQETGGMLL